MEIHGEQGSTSFSLSPLPPLGENLTYSADLPDVGAIRSITLTIDSTDRWNFDQVDIMAGGNEAVFLFWGGLEARKNSGPASVTLYDGFLSLHLSLSLSLISLSLSDLSL